MASGKRRLDALKDVICMDDGLVAQIEEAVVRIMKKRGGERSDQVLAAIDEAVDVVFAECEVFQTISRAIDRVRSMPRLDKSPASPQTSLEKPGFSESEPTKSAQFSRASPKSKSPSPDVGREKGKFLGGKYSPLSEPGPYLAVRARSPQTGSPAKAVNDKVDWSPPPAFQQTESPNLDKEDRSGLEVKSESMGKGSPKGSLPTRPHQETMRHSPARSTPEKVGRPKSSQFGSPGSGLEDDNFEDSFDGGGGSGGGSLDFTKRYRFVDGAPASQEKAAEMSGSVARQALSAALQGGVNESGDEAEEDAVNITDDWLLSRSEGNPDEGSLASTPLLNRSKNSTWSSPTSTGSGSKRSRRSPGGGNRTASPSPSKSPARQSPSRFASVPVTKAEGALRSYIKELERSSPTASVNKSPSRAGARYGGVRDSTDSSSHSVTSGGRSPLLPSQSATSPHSPADGGAMNVPADQKGEASMTKEKGVTGGRSPGEALAVRDGEVALSLEGSSSVDSGGPDALDGGEEVYEAPLQEEETTTKTNSSVAAAAAAAETEEGEITSGRPSAALDRKFRETLRRPLDLNDTDSIVGADDFTNDFEESFDDYGEEGFNSDISAEQTSGDGYAQLSPPSKSASSPNRAKRGGTRGKKTQSGASTSVVDASMESEKSVASEVNYGSDDFEMMDYEADKPNRKRVRFPRESVVSDVFVTREKYAGEEVQELFYTQDEAVRFSLDYSRETMKAEMAGLTWYTWWADREEEDVQKDEEEEEARREAMFEGLGDDEGDLYAQDYDFGDDDFELEVEEEEQDLEILADEEGSNDFDRF